MTVVFKAQTLISAKYAWKSGNKNNQYKKGTNSRSIAYTRTDRGEIVKSTRGCHVTEDDAAAATYYLLVAYNTFKQSGHIVNMCRKTNSVPSIYLLLFLSEVSSNPLANQNPVTPRW